MRVKEESETCGEDGKDGWDKRREGEQREGKWGAEERGGRGIPHKGWVH